MWKENVLGYISSLAKRDGGYGWKGQPDSHLTPTFAAIGILYDLDHLPDKGRKTQLVKFVRTHHPQYGADAIRALLYKGEHHVTYLGAEWKKGSEAGSSGSEMRDLIYQQIQSILWLGGDAGNYDPLVRIWKSQAGNLANYEKHDYPVLYQDMMTPVCRHLLGMEMTDSSATTAYLRSRRRKNGSFNNAPSGDGGDGNVLNTYWSLYALNSLGTKDSLQNETIRWLQSCQLKGGGFTHQPHPVIGVNDEVAYSWAAVKALQLLAAKPANEAACVRYLLSLRNSDGGFGNRPGLPSTPMSTYYAVDALKALDAFSDLEHAKALKHQDKKTKKDFKGLHIYTVQFEAPGVGSPLEAVMLADSLHIQLWGCKNGPDGWVARAQKIADEKKVPVTFFIADEPYGKYVHVNGMGSFGHILDFMSPADVKLPSIGRDPAWQTYDKHYVQPLLRSNGALLLQISNNEPLARMLLDESVSSGGYGAISTIHFDQNFLFWCPYLYQYRYQLPFVALQDAHGIESWWWTDELLGYRTLFLAKEPTYQAMMKALKDNLVVAVRHDALSKYATRILGGAPGVQEYMRSHQDAWKWWGRDSTELIRPWAAITVLRPEDSFEVAHPDQGVNIRIRCWWHASRPVLKTPVVKLKDLRIDDIPVKPRYIEKKDRRGRLADCYYLYPIAKLSEGTHVIKVRLTNTEDHTERVMTKTFVFR
ncbi:MAG TPA: prenyltransferase/squalene oxidase repeat-containing protein [Chitinophagaceae bacterium]|nr:prenyltransferase/squalene oxidase repeat-containing protein [Chitinophagaceae bacterium]